MLHPHIELNVVRGINIISFKHDIDDNDVSEIFSACIEVLTKHPASLVLDCAHVSTFEIDAQDMLCELQATARKANFPVFLCNVQSQARDDLRLGGIETRFAMYDSLEEAIKNIT